VKDCHCRRAIGEESVVGGVEQSYLWMDEPGGRQRIPKGCILNGLRFNGLCFNGLRFNGLRFNGLRSNGLRLQRITLQRITDGLSAWESMP